MGLFAWNGFVSNIIDCRFAIVVDLRLRLYKSNATLKINNLHSRKNVNNDKYNLTKLYSVRKV